MDTEKRRKNTPTNQMPDFSFQKFTTLDNNYNKINNEPSNSDIILQQLKLKTLTEEYAESFLLQDNRYQHYSRQLNRLSFIDNILVRQC